MQLHHRHRWDLSPSEAIALQQQLRTEVVSDRPIDLDAVKLVAGVDVSVKNEQSQAAIVVVTYPGLPAGRDGAGAAPDALSLRARPLELP